MADFMLS